jgi:hypothetical protein
MTVFTDKQAREHLEAVLEEASARGEVRIRLEDGREYQLKPLPAAQPDDPPLNAARRRNLSDLAGTWLEDPTFNQAIRDQDVIDPDLWK